MLYYIHHTLLPLVKECGILRLSQDILQPTGVTVSLETVVSSPACTQLSAACIKCWQAVWGWKKAIEIEHLCNVQHIH